MKKTIAIIPARAGSKGIPNKNIRLVNGKPLIWYAINNAKNSRHINEVVVSTDSPEIIVIAKQMGVKYRERSAELCGDAVTLDAVIYDAIKDIDCGTVITMQPTSPTLRVETLDKAIEFFESEQLDTLISANNRPHLAWTVKDGKTVPAYEKRLNRQYLPPYYVEAGAFVISRREVVTPNSRIGTKVQIFNVPDDESVDIDTYEDLATVSMQLSRPKVAFYVNGNNKRGLGHMYRVMELADEFFVKPDIYFDENQTDVRIFGTTTHNLIPVNGIGKLLAALEQNRYDVFINDVLGTSIDYMIAVRTAIPHAVIINFEDDGEGAQKADLVFNALFSESDSDNVRAGEKYYIASKLFMFYKPIEIKDEVKNVFISFGGADPQNYSDRLLDIIAKDKYKGYDFKVVLGRAKLNAQELLKRGADNIEVSLDIKNMPEIMTQCDIGVTSRGRTGYELALLGIPSIAMAQNKREEKHGFVCEENGFAYLGLNPSDSMIEGMLDLYLHMSKQDRERYQAMLLSHDLRNGRKRVMNLINGCL